MFFHAVEFSCDELNGNDETRNPFYPLFFTLQRHSSGGLYTYAFIYLFITICVNRLAV